MTENAAIKAMDRHVDEHLDHDALLEFESIEIRFDHGLLPYHVIEWPPDLAHALAGSTIVLDGLVADVSTVDRKHGPRRIGLFARYHA